MNKRPKYTTSRGKSASPANRYSPKHKPEAFRLSNQEEIRLNRFIAQAGICSRREADELISAGRIKINGNQIKELGTKVIPGRDTVMLDGKVITSATFEYILLNKPKNTITTTNDPKGRKTVLNAINGATNERVFPVGRLDRNTTGLILITNDGELTKKLTHPSHKVKKIYHVRLNKEVAIEDLQRLLDGIMLEDGMAKVDKIDYVQDKGMEEVGVEIHIGKNRIVRRMFEAMGYEVIALDRVMLAHLTKKNLPRGKWRFLSQREVDYLKML